MAELEVLTPPQPAEEMQQEFALDCIVALNRYIFIRGLESTFVNADDQSLASSNKMKQWSSKDADIVKYLQKMVETDPLAPLNAIKKALNSKSLNSCHEALWCLAYCLCELKNEDLRKEIRKNLSEMLTSGHQLLIFLYAFQLFKNGKMNFGRGMRSALEKWYSTKSTNELFEILFSSGKYEKIDHKSVLHQIHLKLEDCDKNKLLHSVYTKDHGEKLESEAALDKMILKHRQLKRCKETPEVIEILTAKEFNYKLQHIPSFAHKSHAVIDLIIQNLSLSEVIDNLLFFCSQKMLKIQEPVSRKICNALQAPNKVINEAKLHPLHVFEIMKELERRLAIHHHENPHRNENGNAPANDEKSKEKKFSNPFIVKKVQHLFNHTLNEQPKTGCRYFITVDFRRFSKRQSRVHGMRNVLCSELQAIIALALLKNEKEVTVMSFSSDNTKLIPVEWTSETSFEKALEIYENEIKEQQKTKEIITLPLKKALEDKKKVDVFITFVSSLGRTMGKKGKPDQIYAELQNYRKIMNLKMSKYVIINMTRKTPSIVYDEKNIGNKGVLEIVGFSEKAAKIVEAYAKNCFA